MDWGGAEDRAELGGYGENMSVDMSFDLRDLAGDFRIISQCLNQLIARLEKVVSASPEPVDTYALKVLYRIRDNSLTNCRDLLDIIAKLERGARAAREK